MIPNMDVLGSLVANLQGTLSQFFYMALPVGMLLAVAAGYLKTGAPDYVDVLRRALVAHILLVSFPQVANLIFDVCDGLALKIDNQSGLDAIMRMAEEKSRSYAGAEHALLLKFDDLIIAVLSFLSFVILYVARYLTVALYYFFWVLLSVCSPVMILCYLYPSTAGVTRNLYKGLIEVASWKVVWAILSAMLASLSFGNIYRTEGSYLTLIVLNFVIAIALICTPLVVKSLIGEGIQAAAQALGTMAGASMLSLPARVVTVRQVSGQVLSDARSFASARFNSVRNGLSSRR